MTLEESMAIRLAKADERKKARAKPRLPLRAKKPPEVKSGQFNDGWGDLWRHAYSDRHFEQLFGYEKPQTGSERNV